MSLQSTVGSPQSGGNETPLMTLSRTTLALLNVVIDLSADNGLTGTMTLQSNRSAVMSALASRRGNCWFIQRSCRLSAAVTPDDSKSSCIGTLACCGTGRGIDPEQALPPPTPVQNAAYCLHSLIPALCIAPRRGSCTCSDLNEMRQTASKGMCPLGLAQPRSWQRHCLPQGTHSGDSHRLHLQRTPRLGRSPQWCDQARCMPGWIRAGDEVWVNAQRGTGKSARATRAQRAVSQSTQLGTVERSAP